MILSWLDKRDLGSDAQVFCDLTGRLGSSKPKKVGGFVPDVFCTIPARKHTIIGDAKTPDDLETRHTRDQLEAYADYLATHSAIGELVIATRFEWVGCARSLLKSLTPVKARGAPRVRVISEFGVVG
jgi:hypothetical protein